MKKISFQDGARRQRGIALIAAMMILALVATLAISAMQTTMRDQQVAGVQMRSKVAFHAAEAGLAAALATVTGDTTPTLATANIGVAGDYPTGRPGYRLNPDVASPVEYLGPQPFPGSSLNIDGSGPSFQLKLWRIHVQGGEPRGMTSRIEAATAALWGS